ncbi:MAG: hypothetical protein GC151_14105 [Betaproteobacteria bacterium]|nr:hypothetical protein [Betaproteobacteria bacterium]
MSPWWREQVVARIAPGTITLARHARGPQRSVLERDTIPVAANESAVAPWRACLDTLAGAMQDRRWRAAGLAIEVSAHFCRWMLLPPNPAIATDDEWLAYARVELAGVHGDRSNDWDIRLGEQQPRAAVPVCAMDRELVSEARAACNVAKVRFDSLAPAYAAAFNAHAPAFRATVSAFAQIESGRLTLAVLERGRWRALATARVNGPAARVLETELLGMETQGLIPSGTRRLYVLPDDRTEVLPARIGEWDVAVRTAESRRPGLARRGPLSAAKGPIP